MKLTELLQQNGVPFRTSGHHHCTTGWVQTDCPYCSSDQAERFRLGINAAHLNANCWRCGPKRTVDVLATLLRTTGAEVRRLLDGITREIVTDEVKVGTKVLIPFTVFPLRECPHHRQYLRERGFDPDEIERLWGVGGTRLASEWAWRLFIPIQFRGETVSWTTRAVNDQVKAKYVTARPAQEKVHLKRILYGEDYARNTAVIVEGPADVWRVGPGAVCTFGTGYTSSQLRRMARYPVRYVCFDSDEAGQARADRLTDDLSVFPGETYKMTLDAKDPGSASAKEVAELRKTVFSF